MAITVQCPSCSTDFPVDPAKVPEGGVHARCSVCDRVFPVERPVADESAEESFDGPGEDAFGALDGEGFEEPGGDAFGEPAGGGDGEESLGEDSLIVTPENMEVESEPVEGLMNEDDMDPTATFSGEADTLTEPPPTTEEETAEAAETVEPMEGLELAGEDVSGEVPETLETPDSGDAAAPAETEPATAGEGFNPFTQQDPGLRAARLARVLVSDMIMYNPDRHARALENGSLAEDFEDEIEKSWKEYVDQVGKEVAESSDYFNNALNEILARGEDVF